MQKTEEQIQKELEATRQWAAKQFGISPEDVRWYHSGICYDRIGVNSKEAAAKVAEKVKGQTANGGMLHGMPLGGATEYTDEATGQKWYDVHC
jgi:hypothetical protein